MWCYAHKSVLTCPVCMCRLRWKRPYRLRFPSTAVALLHRHVYGSVHSHIIVKEHERTLLPFCVPTTGHIAGSTRQRLALDAAKLQN